MKKSKNILITIVTLFVFAFVFSCSSNDNEKAGCDNFEQAATDASKAYSEALQLYYNSPTTANCAILKSETASFIAVYNDYMDCIPDAEKAEIQEYIAILQETVDEVCK